MKSILEFLVKQHIKNNDSLFNLFNDDQLSNIQNKSIKYKGITFEDGWYLMSGKMDKIIPYKNLKPCLQLLDELLSKIKNPNFSKITFANYDKNQVILTFIINNSGKNNLVIYSPDNEFLAMYNNLTIKYPKEEEKFIKMLSK